MCVSVSRPLASSPHPNSLPNRPVDDVGMADSADDVLDNWEDEDTEVSLSPCAPFRVLTCFRRDRYWSVVWRRGRNNRIKKSKECMKLYSELKTDWPLEVKPTCVSINTLCNEVIPLLPLAYGVMPLLKP